jgi:hypothetical protein
MVEFNTKLALSTYIAKTGAIDGKYCVLNDETMQNKKAFYSFVNGELVFESGGTTVLNWRTSVNTYVLLSGITTPLGMDAVIVTADETHGNNKTWYQHDGYVWNYKGAYQKRETQSFSSLADTRASILKVSDSLTLDFEYITGNDELEVYLDGRLATQYLVEVGDIGFTSKLIKFTIDIPISTDINVRKFVPNIDDEPRTNDEVYVNAFKHNYDSIEKYMKYEKSVVIHYETFADVQNDSLLIKEGQVIRTNGHVTKNDGKGRYWILESADKDYGLKNKANTLFINRLIGADEIAVGTILPSSSVNTGAEVLPMAGLILQRAEHKRLWAYAQSSGNLVDENTWLNEGGVGRKGAYSSGDGVNTFRIPEVRGTHLRALDSGRGLDVNRVVGSYQHDAIRNIAGQFGIGDGLTNNPSATGGSGAFATYASGTTYVSTQNAASRTYGITFDASRVVPTAVENRIKNTAYPYFIKI